MKYTVDWFFSRGYNFNPRISFVINTHNMAKQTLMIVDKLRGMAGGEIVVVDDNSDLENSMLLRGSISGVNEYLIRCNGLFETISVDRAFTFTRAPFIVMLQDDDYFDNTDWLETGLELFQKYPDLGILGGREGVRIFDAGQNLLDFEVVVSNKDQGFRFVQTVNAAPIIFRRAVFEHLGGFRQEYAPCMWSDTEICLRAWLLSAAVGWYPAGLHTFAFENSSRRSDKSDITAKMDIANRQLIKQQFGTHQLEFIDNRVIARNEELKNKR